MRKLRATFVTLSLVVVACGGDGSATTEASSVPTTAATTTTIGSTNTDATTTTTAPATTTTAAATTSTTAAATTTTAAPTTTTIAAATSGSVIVSAEDGVYVVSGGAATQLIAYSVAPEFPSDLIDFAISDTRGGVIIHPNRSPFTVKGSDSIVYWIPKGGSAAQQLLVPAADQGLQLEDVVAQGSSVGVYYTRLEGSTPDDMLQTLRRFDLDSKEVQPLADVAGWESGAWNFSVGGDLIGYQAAGEAFFWFDFRDLTGALLDPPYHPIPDGEFDCYPVCHWAIAVNPDGSQIGWVQRMEGVYWLTIVNTADGSTAANFTLPEGVYEVSSMDLGFDHAVVNRIEEGSELYNRPFLVEIAAGSLGVTEVPLAGYARLTDVIPQLNGVVQYP